MRSWKRVIAGAAAFAVLAPLLACSSDDAKPAPAAKPIVYVALGDSFSAGDGAPPYDADSGKCGRSPESWPRRLDADSPTVVSIDHLACGGAKTVHLTGPWTDRGLPAQIPTKPDPKVTLVTLTIGGNDAGFSDIVAMCFLASCAGVPASPPFLGALQSLTGTLDTSVYPAIERAYPNARIAHVGYPRLTPAPGQPVTGCDWLAADDQTSTSLIVAALNRAIRAAAEASTSVTFVDTTRAFVGHELCTADSWVNPVQIGGTSPAHPTADGYRALERAVAAALKIKIS